MEYALKIKGFENRNLLLKPSLFNSIPKIYLDGEEVKRTRRTFIIRNNHGELVELKVKPRFLDPLPAIYINDNKIDFFPPLNWYEYAWIAVSILLIFAGGAIGAFIGTLAAHINARIFRQDISKPLKFLYSGMISVSALIFYLLIIFHIQTFWLKEIT